MIADALAQLNTLADPQKAAEALAYLERRGIASRELIEQHRLGLANRTLGLRLPATAIKADIHSNAPSNPFGHNT